MATQDQGVGGSRRPSLPLLEEPVRPIAVARLVAAFLILVHVVTYGGVKGFIPHDLIRTLAFVVLLAMVVTSAVQIRSNRALGRSHIVILDGVFAASLLWLYAIDPRGYLFVLLYGVIAEAALLLGPRAALVSSVILGAVYVVRDIFAAMILDVPVSPAGAFLRVAVGIGLAIFTGSLVQTARATRAFQSEHTKAERLREEDEMKTAFLAAVSHDLKNPLTAILGFSTTLRSRLDRLSPERSKEFLDHIVTSARKLERMLNDLLDVDRIQRGTLRPNLTETDMGALIRRVVEETDAMGHPVTVHADDVIAKVDAPKVERIIENLVVNAAKYTPSAEPIDVYVAAQSGSVLVSVEDRGPGIPDDLKEKLFEPFQRAPDAGQRATGSGLGLSLVAKFTQLHGGRAWVEDRDGGGAAFRVTLPLRMAA